MARRQQMAQWQAAQLYGEGGGGVLNGMDMRGDPNDAAGRIAAGMQFMDPEAMKQMQYILGSLNPAQSFHAVEQGDRVTAGAFDPLTGAFAGQGYGVGIDPTKQYGYDKTLEGIMAQVAGGERVARINAQPRHSAPQPRWVQDESGEFVDLTTGRRPGVKGTLPQQPQQPQAAPAGLTPQQLVDLYLGFEKNNAPSVLGGPRPENPILPHLKPLLPGGGQAPMPTPTPTGPAQAGLTQQEIDQLKALGYSDEAIAALGSAKK
jgi:hypothetical protein